MTEREKSSAVIDEKPKRMPSPREEQWEERTLRPTLEKSPERAAEFTTVSSYPIRRLYTPADLADWNPDTDLS
ncbi:MAG: methylmalonyl-CoA mutase, partial [Candidatus Acidiferrales bacterium]